MSQQTNKQANKQTKRMNLTQPTDKQIQQITEAGTLEHTHLGEADGTRSTRRKLFFFLVSFCI